MSQTLTAQAIKKMNRLHAYAGLIVPGIIAYQIYPLAIVHVQNTMFCKESE